MLERVARVVEDILLALVGVTDDEELGELKTVFKDGELLIDYSLAEIREIANKYHK